MSDPNTDERQADKAAQAVIDELSSRRGFDRWWDDLDHDIQEGIEDALAEKIADAYQ